MNEARKKPRVEVCPLTYDNAGAAAEFFREVWDPEATPEKVQLGLKHTAESHPFYPGLQPPSVLFLSDGHALGYCGSISVAVRCGDREQRADWVKGLMVLPAHRNGPIGYLMAKDLLPRLEHPLSLAVGEPARRLLGALGMTDLGMVPNFLRLLKAGEVLKKLDLEGLGIANRLPRVASGIRLSRRLGLSPLVGICADAAIRLNMGLRSKGAKEVDVTTAWPLKSELDDLWQQSRGDIGAACVRDGRYIPWRYGDSSIYGMVATRSHGELTGVAIVRRPRKEGDPRLKGIRIAVLADLLFSPRRTEAGSALLSGAEAMAKEFGSEAILCSASHSSMVSLLPRHGYFRIPANMHFLLANRKEQLSFPTDLSTWWITRGDSNADEVF